MTARGIGESPDLTIEPPVVDDVPGGAADPVRPRGGGGRPSGGTPGTRSKVPPVSAAARLPLSTRGSRPVADVMPDVISNSNQCVQLKDKSTI